MKVLFDTSVLIAAMTKTHPHHAASQPWLNAALQGRLEFFVSTHTLAEVYSTLSGKIGPPYMTTPVVWQLLETMILQQATIISLDRDDYVECLQRMVSTHERGGVTYDTLIIQAALKAGDDKLLTLNSKHFSRLWPNHTDQVINPTTTQAS